MRSFFLAVLFFSCGHAFACKPMPVELEVPLSGGEIRMDSGTTVILKFDEEPVELVEHSMEGQARDSVAEFYFSIESPVAETIDDRPVWERAAGGGQRLRTKFFANKAKLKPKFIKPDAVGMTRSISFTLRVNQTSVPMTMIYTFAEPLKARGGCGGNAEFQAN